MTDQILVPAPFDAHLHLRQGELLRQVAPYTDEVCSRALLMPNTEPPIDTPDRLAVYQREVSAALRRTEPLFTFKITPGVARMPEYLQAFKQMGCVAGKLYPEGVTTNSQDGVDAFTLHTLQRSDNWLIQLLRRMADYGLVLCVHGEMPNAFVLDREESFLSCLHAILNLVPGLRVVLEHVTTEAGVRFVFNNAHSRSGTRPQLAATITPHHLMMTLDDVIGDKIRPHNFCKPVAKARADRESLIKAATSGSPFFFLGSDSAPHPVSAKECASGCAGVFCAPVMLPVLATVFEENGLLSRLPGFVHENGANFYGLLPAAGLVRLSREPWRVPDSCGGVVPFLAGQRLTWKAVRLEPEAGA
jgi:dihydroorotase